MTPRTETASPATGSNGADVNDTIITCSSDTMIKSSPRNRGQGHGQGDHTWSSGHPWCAGRGGRFNWLAYTSSIRNFKGEVDKFGAVLWTTYKQREPKDYYKKFSKKLNQYILQNSTLCGKFTIINSQHPHWIKITTGGNHHELNHEEYIKHQHH